MPNAVELMDSRKFMDSMKVLIQAWAGKGVDFPEKGCDEESMAASLQSVLDAAGPQAQVKLARQEKMESLGLVPVGRPIVAKIAAGPQDEIKTEVYNGKFGKETRTPIGNIVIGKDDVEIVDILNAKPKRTRRTKAEMLAGVPKGVKLTKPFNYDKATEKAVAAQVDAITASQPTREQNIAEAVNRIIKPVFHTVAPAWDGFRHFIVKLDQPNDVTLSGNGNLWKDALKASGIPVSKLEVKSDGLIHRQLEIMIL